MAGNSAAAPRVIEASVNFVGPMTERPFVDVNNQALNRLDLVAHTVAIHDARPLAGQLSLQKEGFILVQQKLPAIDFQDHDEINRRYLPVIQDLVQSVTGASRIITSDGPVVRLSAPDRQRGRVAYPAGFVHTDYTDAAARVHMRTSHDRALDEAAGRADTLDLLRHSVEAPSREEQKYRRVTAVQTWRVFSDPPHDKPLALCAANSVSSTDVVEYDYVVGDFKGVTLQANLYRHNDNQRWFYFSDMRPDEVLIFVGFDFQSPATARVLHTAFDDPLCPKGTMGRCSIEARTFAFFED